MHVAHVNVRSLIANFDPFQYHLMNTGYDIVSVTETWLCAGADDGAVGVANYNFFGQSRPSRRGGGVGLYIKKNIRCEILSSASLDCIEQLWAKIIFPNQIVIMGIIYRPPNSDLTQFFNLLEDSLSNIYSEFDNIICVGDFNINMLNLNTVTGSRLESVFSTFNMEQLIKEPTRVALNSVTLLDLIFTNMKGITDVGVVDSNTADHFLVYMRVNMDLPVSESSNFSYRSLKNINFNEFQMDLERLPFNNILYLHDIDEKLNYFNSCILSLFNKHAPVKQFCGNKKYKYAPWITENIKLLQRLRNKALKKYKQTKLPTHYDYYKQLRNYTTAAIRSEKKAYLRMKFQNCSPKEKWKELKRLNLSINKRKLLPDHLSDANKINNFFINSANNHLSPKPELLDFYNNHSMDNINERFNFVLCTENEILNVLKNIKTKATGSDEINITLIYLCCPYIVPYVTHIVNECILTSYFPTLWKQAQVIPLPKISNPTKLGHLRSISILPTLSKVLERVMNTQILNFLNINQILPVKQSGFRPGYSCESALCDITDDILKATNDGKVSVLVLLDFSKAFDMLNHKILLAILNYIGFSENACHFLSSFLTGRSQQVVCNQRCSSLLDVRLGVPQGSILGPLLYTVFTFNFFRSLQYCDCHFYADDTQIYYSFYEHELNTAEERIVTDLTNFYNAASDHLLNLNPSKSSVVLFGNENQVAFIKHNMIIKLNNVPLTYSDSSKSLGLIIDSKLRFKEHVTAKLRIAYCNLKLIYGNRYYLSQETRKLLCDSLVLSQFSHCSAVYVPCLDAVDRYRIQKVQNSCLRLIYGVKRRNRISPYLVMSGWLNMFNRFKLRSNTFYFKIIKFKSPTYLYKKITFRTDVHHLTLRRKHYLTIPQHRKEIFKRSFSYNIASCINNLENFNIHHSIMLFKNNLRKRLHRSQR